MKRVIPFFALLGGLFLAILVAGGGFAAGQQNPIVPPATPTPPSGWPVGVPYPLTSEMINGALDRVAPSAPTGFYTSTVKITVGGVMPVTCETTVQGQQFLPDFVDAQDGKDTCSKVVAKALAAGKEVELEKLKPAPIKSTIKTDPFGGCEVNGDPELARGCFDLARDGMANLHPALPDPFPPALPLPLVRIIEQDVYDTPFVVKAVWGTGDIELFDTSLGSQESLTHVYIADTIYGIVDAEMTSGGVRVTYFNTPDFFRNGIYTLAIPVR